METTALLIGLAALLFGLVVGWFVARQAAAGTAAAGKETAASLRAMLDDAAAEREKLKAEHSALAAEHSRGQAENARLAERLEAFDTLRQEHDSLRTELTGHGETIKTLGAERAQLAERLEGYGDVHGKLGESDTARRKAETELAGLKKELVERERAFEERHAEREKTFERELARLSEAEEKLQTKFNEIGEKLLDGARTKFLEGAGTHLATLNKESLAALEKKVGPVGETLDRYRKRVEELEKGRAEAWHQLQGVIGEVRSGQERVLEGANRITTTLKGATKARGDWGEFQFENLLESCGLRDRTDFKREVGIKDGEGKDLRPDAIINIPGGRKLIVDVKNVFNTYKEANEAETEEQRQVLLQKHARELRGHVQALSAKRYQDHVPGSADFVVLFVPGEHVLYAALMQEEALLDYALRQNVVLSSPLNFMSIAMTVATVWRQAGVQADADEIAKLGKELYDRLATVARHISNLRRDLGKANKSFDSLVGSFDTNLRRTGERFEELSVDTSAKELSEALPIGHQPRKLTNFASEAREDADA